MSSQASFGSSMMFHSMNEDLNASLATADELSREFSSLLREASSQHPSASLPESTSLPSPSVSASAPATPTSWETGGVGGAVGSLAYSPTGISRYTDSAGRNMPSSPVAPTHTLTPPQIRRDTYSTSPRRGSNTSVTYGQLTPPNQSPRTRRAASPRRQQPFSSLSYVEPLSPGPSYDQSPWLPAMHPSPTMLSPYDAPHMGRRSPRPDRSPSPRPFSHASSSTLPRSFHPFRTTDEGTQRQKSPAKWNETDLDMSYEKKTNHTYDKTEWLRPSVPNSNWRESNLDGPPTASKKDSLSSYGPSHASLPRNTRISVPPDRASPPPSPYQPQPIISRISIPPSAAQTRQRRPIPLSVILRLQNPRFNAAFAPHPRAAQGEGDAGLYRQSPPQVPNLPREYLYHLQPQPPELRQPAYYGEVLNPGDVDAELERLDPAHGSVVSERGREAAGGGRMEAAAAPRPLSPTRLQPVVAPQAQTQAIPDLEVLLRLRAEIPRALKRRGSVDQSSQAEKKMAAQPPNQYKQMINKLFHRKGRHKGEPGSENSSSSEGEESSGPPSPVPTPLTQTPAPPEHRGYHSILRGSHGERQGSGCRARLSPLVLLLDGALVGELDTVQRAVQEMSDPSQPNDEGITALHNAICGGHYGVVDFLVRIGANVSAPDSHGWTPLHCAASCNDRPLCEFLVRNGAAVMAVTESDGATASQKCDPYAVGFEECETFLRGVEDAMGVENSGVLYALWSYPAQAADELSFKEGDMVTILQKAEGVDWWWASLCGREGFIPNNYFGLFPKVRPKSLC